MENTIIAIAAHKPYWMPQDALYTPVQAGAQGRESLGWQRDDTGENISGKNKTYCELTVLYWLWKNTDAALYGLAHYRRYLAAGWPFRNKRSQLLTGQDIQRLMRRTDILLPKKRHYWIETNESQYIHAHHAEDLAAVKAALADCCAQALPAWDTVMRRRSGHRFNMFLMRREPFQAYCAWLFPILAHVEAHLDISAYTPKDQRVIGYLSERLLDVWLLHFGYHYRETRVVNLENQHWCHKAFSFLRRKFTANA